MNKLNEILKRDLKIQKDCSFSSTSNTDSTIIDSHLNCQKYLTQQVEFTPSRHPDTYLEELKERYHPINKMNNTKDMPTSLTTPLANEIPQPRKILFNSENLQMKWSEPRPIGSGLCNLGNTCFLNSVLQCLTYTPPLYNYLSSNHHKTSCSHQGFCSMCVLQDHVTRIFKAEGVVKPLPIVHRLKDFAKHLRFGRQEDAHEFLRYFIESLQKVCLQGHPPKMDVYTKCTTVIHQIFGGYHRSQVKCLKCNKTSNTYDPLLDISLDIKGCPTLQQALKLSIKPDILDNENKYACPFCKELTRAKKHFTIHSLPNVLTIQLKRFEYNTLFGGKINKTVQYSERLNMRPFMSETQGPEEWYDLYAVLVHFGFSCNSGHYYCYVKNSNNVWYSMNDTLVHQVSQKTVLSQEAYLLFYIKDMNSSHLSSTPTSFLSSPVTPQVKTIVPSTKVSTSVGVPIKRTSDENIEKIRPKPTGVVNPSPKMISPPSSASLCVDNSKILGPSFKSSFQPNTPTNNTKPSNLVSPQISTTSTLKLKDNTPKATPTLPFPTSKNTPKATPTSLFSASKDTPKTTPTTFVPRSVSKSSKSPAHVTSLQSKKSRKVAYVSPIVTQTSKPIARVLPNLKETEIPPSTSPSSDDKKGRDQTPPSSVNGWKVMNDTPVLYGPELPPDLLQGTCPSWRVTSLKENEKIDKKESSNEKERSNKKRRQSEPVDFQIRKKLRKHHKDHHIKHDLSQAQKLSDDSYSESDRKNDDKKSHHHKSYRRKSSPVRSHKSVSGKSRRQRSPVSYSRKSYKSSPIRSRRSPERSRKSPEFSPERSHKSPERSRRSPERSCKSPEFSPERSRKSPERSRKSPEFSPDRSRKSPERHHKSSGDYSKSNKERHPHNDKSSRDWKHDEKRRSSPYPSSSSHKHRAEVEEIKWDRAPPYRSPATTTNNKTNSNSITACNNNNTVLDSLEKSDQLGSKVKTWDGEKNTIDSCTIKTNETKKRGRDDWDREIDQGKVKKIKKKSMDDWSSSKNKFQSYQNKKNSKRF